MQIEEIREIISKHEDRSGKILGILEEIQDIEGYLKKDTLMGISKELDVPLSQLYSLSTFYSFFNLQPLGRHVITVCMGTACHVKGAFYILERLQELLGVQEGEVTADGKFLLTTEDHSFSLNMARCFGCCSMAPVINIDGTIYGHISAKDLPEILEKYDWRE